MAVAGSQRQAGLSQTEEVMYTSFPCLELETTTATSENLIVLEGLTTWNSLDNMRVIKMSKILRRLKFEP